MHNAGNIKTQVNKKKTKTLGQFDTNFYFIFSEMLEKKLIFFSEIFIFFGKDTKKSLMEYLGIYIYHLVKWNFFNLINYSANMC
jgi:hypothetical protein